VEPGFAVTLLDRIGPGPVALDTCVFIYFMEANQDYLPVLDPVFEKVDAGGLLAVCSSLTLLETLVVPYRMGDQDLAARYELVLTRSRGLVCEPIGTPTLKAAAMLRARTGARTPDAVHLATAIQAGCKSFVTNDRRLPSLGRLDIIQIDDYLQPVPLRRSG
jgi:predicted nucleic acid-binding protein